MLGERKRVSVILGGQLGDFSRHRVPSAKQSLVIEETIPAPIAANGAHLNLVLLPSSSARSNSSMRANSGRTSHR